MRSHLLLFFLSIVAFNVSYGQHLGAIVMPFHRKQLNKLLFNLESWKTFLPSKTAKMVELVIYNSGPADGEITKDVMKFFRENPMVANNFSNITVQFARLRNHKDSYFRGTRSMFESLLFWEEPLKIKGRKSVSIIKFINPQVKHVFYMEPDCLPIKSNWLDALHSEVRRHNGNFWMLGSKFAGEIKWFGNHNEEFVNHLNGNSIYNVGSKEFRQFYRQEVIPNYPVTELVPYDLKIPQILYANKKALLHKFGSQFVSTRVIVNTGGSNLWASSGSKLTFLQHICDNWDDYWHFYQNVLPPGNKELLEKLKSLIKPK